MVKFDPDAVRRMLAQGRYVYGMASFTLDGESFEYLKPEAGHSPEDANSWTYGQYPKIRAAVPWLTAAPLLFMPLRSAGTPPTSL